MGPNSSQKGPVPGQSVQVDVKFVPHVGRARQRFYQFTAIDEATRHRVLRIYDYNNTRRRWPSWKPGEASSSGHHTNTFTLDDECSGQYENSNSAVKKIPKLTKRFRRRWGVRSRFDSPRATRVKRRQGNLSRISSVSPAAATALQIWAVAQGLVC